MIQLRALGVLDLRTADNAEIRQVLAQPKRAALLTYLTLATPRGPHPRDQLLAMFWPEQAPEPARNALSQALYFLRRALGDDLIVSQNGDSLAVAPSLIWCDVMAFDEAIREGKMDAAVELYRGDFLDGFHVANAPEFERWLDAERQRLGGQFEAALEAVAAQYEKEGNHAAALTARRRLAVRAPYNSAVALRLMRSLAASGDPAAAVQHAHVHEKMLRSELDVPLPAEITAFVAELHARPPAQPSSTVPSAPASPPAPPLSASGVPRAEPHRDAWSWRSGRRRVAILTVVLLTACVGVAYAVVTRDSPDEYLMELYERGQNAEVNRSQVGLQTALRYYRSATDRDSTFALGYSAQSQAHSRLAHYDYANKSASLDSERILAQRAVTLDSTLADARLAMAVSLANSGHFSPAEQEFRRAIALDPDRGETHAYYGMLLLALGRGKEALAEAETALKLEPLGSRVAQTVKAHANFLITGHRAERKLPAAKRRPILDKEPGEPWARAQQAVDHADEGNCTEAKSDIRTAQDLVADSNMVMLAFTGIVDLVCGDEPKARAVLARMKRRADAREHGLRVAVLHARLGEKDSAFAWLDQHHWMMSEYAMLRAAPLLDSLRADPRLTGLMRRLGVR